MDKGAGRGAIGRRVLPVIYPGARRIKRDAVGSPQDGVETRRVKLIFEEGSMCGIVGYIGPRDATPIILNGLKRLEYRGYDSAGLAVLQNSHIEVRRDAGKLARLASLVEGSPVSGHVGIGHTRWATHGEPSARNAHPHLGMTGDVVVVHNGIVENFLELREELSAEGAVFNSDTDTEVIVHLVERYLSGGKTTSAEAARKALCASEGRARHCGAVGTRAG